MKAMMTKNAKDMQIMIIVFLSLNFMVMKVPLKMIFVDELFASHASAGEVTQPRLHLRNTAYKRGDAIH